MGDFLMEKNKKIIVDSIILIFLIFALIFSLINFSKLIKEISYSSKQIGKIKCVAEDFIFERNKFYIKLRVENYSDYPVFVGFYDIFYKINFNNFNLNGRLRNFNFYFTIDNYSKDYILIEIPFEKEINASLFENNLNIEIKGVVAIETNPIISKYRLTYTLNNTLNLKNK
jgi:hypothetical protein